MPPFDEILFESRDTEIFTIPDTKTKLNTLQNYFFPRLQRLLDLALFLTDTFLQVYAWDGATLLAENDDYEWPFSRVFLYLSEGCSTVRNGLWNDPTIWSCFRVPTAADKVQVLHTVTISKGIVGKADGVMYGPGGMVKFEQDAKLQIES